MGGEGTSKEMEDIELPFTNEICLAFLFCRLVLMKIKMFHHKTLKSMTHTVTVYKAAQGSNQRAFPRITETSQKKAVILW